MWSETDSQIIQQYQTFLHGRGFEADQELRDDALAKSVTVSVTMSKMGIVLIKLT